MDRERKLQMTNILRGALVAGAMGLMSYGVFANSDLMNRDSRNSRRFQETNICKPAKMLMTGIQDELSTLTNGSDLSRRIDKLTQNINQRTQDINQTQKKLDKVRAQFNSQTNRFDKLTNHMAEEIASLEKKIAQQKQVAKKRKNDIPGYQKKRNNCHGGMLGYFCRKKWDNKMDDAKKDIKNAQVAQKQLKKKIASLPGERDSLPATIAASKKMVNRIRKKLSNLKTISPTIAEMEHKRERLVFQDRDNQRQANELQQQLDDAKFVLKKCRHMRTLAKVHPLMMDQVEKFKQNPALCNSLDTLLQYTNKEFERIALTDAHKAVCQGMPTAQESTNTDVIVEDRGPVERIIKLEDVIETPTAANGEYEPNLRTADRQPVKIGSLGGEGNVKQIRFHVSYDIEAAGHTRMFDYLLIKDAAGNEIKKVAGSGEEEIVVDSSRVDIFFYSDGRGAGRGVVIDDVEATIIE